MSARRPLPPGVAIANGDRPGLLDVTVTSPVAPKPDPFAVEVAAEADRIEAGAWSAEEAGQRIRETERCARVAGDAETRRYHRVRCAAWAMVALRAEARERAAKAAKEAGDG